MKKYGWNQFRPGEAWKLRFFFWKRGSGMILHYFEVGVFTVDRKYHELIKVLDIWYVDLRNPIPGVDRTCLPGSWVL